MRDDWDDESLMLGRCSVFLSSYSLRDDVGMEKLLHVKDMFST
jgi:hypothetical protein